MPLAMGDWQQASPIPANIPKGFVTEWTVDDVQNWLSQSMQLPQYLELFEGKLPWPPLLLPLIRV
jgi:SAM domain (Sterile alpha motif)